ncbi:hypothetical protein PG995_004230 [Apiospora arundinis]
MSSPHQRNWRRRGPLNASSNNHSSPKPENQKPCNFFLRTGTCHYGAGCKFSHETGPMATAAAASRSSRSTANAETEHERNKYLEWKRLLRRQPSSVDNITALKNFWSQALDIVESSEIDRYQMLVRDLIDDQYQGCLYLIRTLDMRANGRWDDVWWIARDMLKLITQPKILDCLSIDTPVGTLYSVISGSNGSRLIPFLTSLCAGLESSCRRQDIGILELSGLVQLVLDATYEVLRREKRVAFCETLPALFDLLDLVIPFLDTESDRQMKADKLGVLRKIAQLSTGLMTTPVNGSQARPPGVGDTTPSVYPRELKLPGTRHDNDHLNIAHVSILPTVDELSSDQADYLPSTDFRQPHFLDDPVQRYLDTHFRLLRHDVFGPLKEVLGALMSSVARNDGALLKPQAFDANVHLYLNSSISHVSVDDKRGFEIHITFMPPRQLRGKSTKERQQWWSVAKRLEVGSLLYLVFAAGDSVVLLALTASDKGPRGVAGAYPGNVLPVLENLQRMMTLGELPFQEWIIPKPEESPSRTRNLEPPRYARAPGFRFSLDPIVTGDGPPLSLSAFSSPDDASLIDQLEARLTLDRGQCPALVAALTQEFSLIQGPPGTGKSYLGVQLIRVLLGCQKKANVGPILIICYTNHALDQFLMHLKHVGITKFIRIGGQSRTRQLDEHNLRTVSAGATRTGHEGYLLGSTYSFLEDGMKRMGANLATFHQLRKDSIPSLGYFLSRKHPKVYSQFFEKDADGFTRVGKDPIGSWLGSTHRGTSRPAPETLDEEASQALLRLAERDVDSVSPTARRRLVDVWLRQMKQDRIELLHENIVETEGFRNTINTVHSEVNRRTLADADVIGITTTGMARDVSLLRGLRSKVVLCEEAGEVLEAHVVSALLPSVEHVIQIGDHQQLRPTINNWSTLSLESSRGQDYQLDRSQFERLALGQPGLPPMPIAQLNIQRRMRPDIANLLRRTMYPKLEDHQSILDLPHVVGMRESLFWLNHDHLEDAAGDDGRLKSHSNMWEVGMVQALVRHIVRQGVYKSDDIAVLTPYTGNLQKLRASLSSDFEITMSDRDEDAMARDGFSGSPAAEDAPRSRLSARKERLVECLRLATVDNFQGEEAKVIIVSLVRSNTQRKVGFLRTPNRINVLLSRAQHGMYLIGNVDTYSNIAMWNEVRRQLEAAGRIGRALELCCPRHPTTAICCSEPHDFARLSPEGGCSLACDRRLARCGHRCQARCHAETMHEAFLCPQPCPRRHDPCGHGCDKLCGEDCGKCMVPVRNVLLPCRHFADDVPCHQAQQPSGIVCRVEVSKEVPGCNHAVNVPCNTDVNAKDFHCPTKCDALLGECGHSCSGTCGKCRKDEDGVVTTVHQLCKVVCKRPRDTCGHICQKRCHAGEPCGPCHSRCEVRCAHSRCSLPCQDPCPPCIEKCAWFCAHQGGCSMPCAAPCDRLPCDERCQKPLSCGHRCPGLCGETCLEGYCQACEQRLDNRLSCGHFFTAESLDGLVNVAAVYTFDAGGRYSGIKEPSEVLPLPSCPDCKQPIRQFATQRYNRIINMAVMDETSKKFQMKGEARLKKLEELTDALETSLEDSHAELVKDDRHTRVPGFERANVVVRYHSRYGRCIELRKEVQAFCKEASNEQQPAKKLADAIAHSRRRAHRVQLPSLDENMAQLHLQDAETPTPAAYNQQITLGARMAQLRVDDIMLRDQLRFVGSKPSSGITIAWPKGADPTLTARLFLRDSEAFIDDCQTSRLPRLAVQASITFARIVGYMGNHVNHLEPPREEGGSSGDGEDEKANAKEERDRTHIVTTTRRRLEDAAQMCEAGFEGADELLVAVQGLQRLFEKERYEIVTTDELASIKAAMVSGRGGIATHSGHWYKCRNGHIFAIGECGMPMELARCPECRAPIGGQSHQLVEGATRAEEMEQ